MKRNFQLGPHTPCTPGMPATPCTPGSTKLGLSPSSNSSSSTYNNSMNNNNCGGNNNNMYNHAMQNYGQPPMHGQMQQNLMSSDFMPQNYQVSILLISISAETGQSLYIITIANKVTSKNYKFALRYLIIVDKSVYIVLMAPQGLKSHVLKLIKTNILFSSVNYGQN
jgi:hypothetical protein